MSMIIPEEYGGLGGSAIAYSTVVAMPAASRSRAPEGERTRHVWQIWTCTRDVKSASRDANASRNGSCDAKALRAPVLPFRKPSGTSIAFYGLYRRLG